MLSNLNFDYSRFVSNRPHTLPLDIPPGCNEAVIFSLKTQAIYEREVYLWNSQKASFMLNILFLWDEISPVFAQIEKSRVYNSPVAEVYCFRLRNDFVAKFDTLVEAIAHARLLLELAVEKANKIKVCQMNYLTVYDYLEQIEVYDLLTSVEQNESL